MDKQKVVVAGFLLNEDAKVLVVKRSKKSKILPKHYELPGGKIKFGEDPDAALRREFLEETGLEVRVCNPFYVCSYSYKDKEDVYLYDQERQMILIVYFVSPLHNTELKSFELTLSDEHSDYKWINLKILKTLKVREHAKKAIEFGLCSCCKK